MSLMPQIEIDVEKSFVELEYNQSITEVEIKKPSVEISGAGAKGQTGDGFETAEVSYGLFLRAGVAAKDDDLFPTLETMNDYNGITLATRVINRNIDNNLIVESVVETYTYSSKVYTWTTTWIETTDILKNRPGTPSVAIT